MKLPAYTESTFLIDMEIPFVGLVAIANLEARGIFTVRDYLSADVTGIRNVGIGRLARIDAFLKDAGFDLASSRFDQFSGRYVVAMSRTWDRKNFHLLAPVHSAWPYPRGVCYQPLAAPRILQTVPVGRTFCGRCSYVIDKECERRG